MLKITGIVICSFVFMGSSFGQAPILDWAFASKNLNAPSGYVGTGSDLCVIGEFLYVVGTFAGESDFDPGQGVATLTPIGGSDIFVQKLDTNGNLIWIKQIGGPGDDGSTIDGPPFNFLPRPLGLNILTTNGGDLIISGSFTDSIDCDPSVSSELFLYSGGENVTACFVMRMNDDGDLIWAEVTSTATSNVVSADIDDFNNIFLVGHFFGDVDFDPSLSDTHTISSSTQNAFIQKLSPDGNLEWIIRLGDDFNITRGQFVQIDNSNNVIVSGTFQGSVDFDPSSGNYQLSVEGNNGIESTFLSKYSNNRELLWAGAFQGSSYSWSQRLAVDEDNSIYVTQAFAGSVDVDPQSDTLMISGGSFDAAFVCKTDSTGDLDWYRVLSGGPAAFSQVYPSNISISELGVLVSGNFNGEVDFNVDSTSEILIGETDGFVLNLNKSGNQRWVHSFGSRNMDVRAIEVFGSSIYGTGYSATGVLDCNPNENLDSVESDFFCFKWIEQGTIESVSTVNSAPRLTFYPNPVFSNTDRGRLEFDNPIDFQMSLYSLEGRLISTTEYVSTDHAEIIIGESPGVYVLQVITEGYSESIKIIRK